MKYVLFIILLLIPLKSYAVLCQWDTIGQAYYGPSCAVQYPNSMPDSVNCTASCETEPWRGPAVFVAPLIGSGYCGEYVGTTLTIEYAGWSKVYDECSAFYRILQAATACAPSSFLQSSYGAYDLRLWDADIVLPPYTGEYPETVYNITASSITVILDFPTIADVPAENIYVSYPDSSWLLLPNGFNPSSMGLNLNCNNYSFSGYMSSAHHLDACHIVGFGVPFYHTALDYKKHIDNFGQATYSIDISGFILPAMNQYTLDNPPALFYGLVYDSFGNPVGEYGTYYSTANLSFFSDSLTFELCSYDEAWTLLSCSPVTPILLGSGAEPVTWYDVYNQSGLNIASNQSTFTVEYQGAAPVFNIEYGGVVQSDMAVVAGTLLSSCAVTVQGASYVNVLGIVTSLTYSFNNGVYDFTDYNNASGSVAVDVLDCNNVASTYLFYGDVPTCSFTGSGGVGGGIKVNTALQNRGHRMGGSGFYEKKY